MNSPGMLVRGAKWHWDRGDLRRQKWACPLCMNPDHRHLRVSHLPYRNPVDISLCRETSPQPSRERQESPDASQLPILSWEQFYFH